MDLATGEVSFVDGADEHVSRWRRARHERWVLKSAACRLLPYEHRSRKCFNFRLPNHTREVWKGSQNGKAFYHGMQVCASVWCCPVCASKISERRRQEVAKAIEAAKQDDLKVYLLTLTVPHGIGDDAREILNRLRAAWNALTQTRAGRNLRSDVGFEGSIRAIETTYGANGFHPHFHVLLFLRTDLPPEDVQVKFVPVWKKAAVNAGLGAPSDRYGCSVDGGERAAKYVTKGSSWGLDAEVTKSNLKSGKNSSRSPLDLLRDFVNGDKKAGAIWKLYAEAFQGSRQLCWSKGLKKRFGVNEASDDEISNQPEDIVSMRLAEISDPQWKHILQLKLQASVLDLAEAGFEALDQFLSGLSGVQAVVAGALAPSG